ncbi:MAG: rod shape-determining protein MreC [Bacillota bacterium]
MNNQRWFIMIGIVFFLVTGLMFFTSKIGTRDNIAGVGIKYMARPLEILIYKFQRYLHEVGLTVVELGRLREENRRLAADLAGIKEENNLLKIYRRENIILRESLALKSQVIHLTVAAEVVAYNPNNYFATITINKGKRHGLSSEMVVITKQGLVGRIIQTQANFSQVMMISDGQHTVGGIVERTRDLVKVVGYPERAGYCKVIPMENELYKVRLKKGDTVITWEQSEYFPKALVVGKIVKVVKSSSGSIGILRPAADLNHLQVVLVITQRKD